MGLVNHPEIPIVWAIAHENDHKRKNDEFSVMPLKHVLSVIDKGIVNRAHDTINEVLGPDNSIPHKGTRYYIAYLGMTICSHVLLNTSIKPNTIVHYS
jgi:hypothetical protein